MQNIFSAASPLALAVSLSLAGCGGGGEDAASSAGQGKFNSTDDVAGTFAALNALGTGLFVAIDGAEAKSGNAAKAASGSHGFAGRSQVNAQPKATTTENCGAGGSVSFTDDTSTVYVDDGSTVASSCRTSNSYGNGTETYSYNGRLSDKCTDSAQTTDACRTLTKQVANGANGSSTLDFSHVSTNSSDRADFTLKARADLSTSEDGSSESLTLTGSLTFDDRIDNAQGTAGFSDFRSVYTYGSSGTDTETLNGSFSVSSNKAHCNIGRVTVRTTSPLTYNSVGSTIAGEVTLTDSSGQAARVNANSDGSTTVTLPNGQTRTYSEAQLENLCS